jgi:creatinine amidohydrolase
MLAEQLTWREYDAAIRESIIILPVGATEQHGPHMPLNVDVVIANSFARAVAKKLKAIILPPIYYGYKSHPATGGGQDFPGTTSLNGLTLSSLVHDILSETHRHGGGRFLIMNGHLENLAFILEGVDLFLKQTTGVRVMTLSWWDVASETLRDKICRKANIERWEDDHAALTETSLMLHFAPELVRTDQMVDEECKRRVPYSIFPTPGDLIPESGLMYKVAHASSEIGEKLATQVTEAMVEAIQLELS